MILIRLVNNECNQCSHSAPPLRPRGLFVNDWCMNQSRPCPVKNLIGVECKDVTYMYRMYVQQQQQYSTVCVLGQSGTALHAINRQSVLSQRKSTVQYIHTVGVLLRETYKSIINGNGEKLGTNHLRNITRQQSINVCTFCFFS